MVSTENNLPALAHSYRRLVLWVGVQIVASLPQSFLMVQQDLSAAGRVNAADPGWASVILTLAASAMIWASVVALAIYGYRTARSLGSSVAWVWAIAMVVPLVNLLSLLVLSRKATNVCRQHGIPVGLFGPKIPA